MSQIKEIRDTSDDLASKIGGSLRAWRRLPFSGKLRRKEIMTMLESLGHRHGHDFARGVSSQNVTAAMVATVRIS